MREIIIHFGRTRPTQIHKKHSRKNQTELFLCSSLLFVGTCAMLTPMFSGLTMPLVLVLHGHSYRFFCYWRGMPKHIVPPEWSVILIVFASMQWLRKQVAKKIDSLEASQEDLSYYRKTWAKSARSLYLLRSRKVFPYKLKLEKIATSQNWANANERH